METLIKVISVCKSELITYDQIKELKKILNIKKKLIVGALANNGYKFKLEESDVSLKLNIMHETHVISYIDKKIKEIIDKINNNDKNDSAKYIEYSKQLIEVCEDKNKLKDNFETICSKYIPLHIRIILISGHNLTIENDGNIKIVKINNIKPVFTMMAVANHRAGPTHFKHNLL